LLKGEPPVTTTALNRTDFLWLDLTRRCQLGCRHCYNGSSTTGEHGEMTPSDWKTVLDSAAEVGTRRVQFIGGEVTTHPLLVGLAAYALGRNLEVEVYTNLFTVTPAVWGLFRRPGVRVATSYYSADPEVHDRVTGRAGSHARTRENILAVLAQSIPLRVSVIDLDGPDIAEAARAELETLGVADVAVSRSREFGRAAPDGVANLTDTCGRCGYGRAAIGPDGTVTPCVFTAGAPAGNVRLEPLADLLAGQAFADQVARLDAIRAPGARMACDPDGDSKVCGPVHPEPDPN